MSEPQDHCAFFIDLYTDDLANFPQFDTETQTVYCETVRNAVADADAQGVRSFEHAVGTAYPDIGASGFELSSCSGNELAKLNDMFFNQLYVGVCGGAATPSQDSSWIRKLVLIALVAVIVVLIAMRLLKN